MRPVGLICEGETDRAVLAWMLAGMSAGNVSINAIQPPDPKRGADRGGWEDVFKSIERRDVSGALDDNAFVIIQIDTDVCEHPNFGVSRRIEGRERTTAELVAAVRERLTTEILTQDPDADLDRVVFAICVNEVECWLLLHLSERNKTTGCFEATRYEANKAGISLLRKDVKDPRAYADAAKGLRKPPAIERIRGRAEDLDLFLADVTRQLAR